MVKTGLPLPRFVSVTAKEANIRTGPGVRYPIDWVIVRAGMPLQVIDEYELWRKVRDADGAVGWVHRGLLSGDRTALVVGDDVQSLYQEPNLAASRLALAEPGVIAGLLACRKEWCQVDIAGHEGWIRRSGLWGVQPGEAYP